MKTITSEQYHDRASADYDERMGSPYHALFREITWVNVAPLLPEAPSDLPILDAGTGTGYWALRLAERGYRVVATDTSEGMLEAARKAVETRGLADAVEVKKADITRMDGFLDGSFAVVFAEGDLLTFCRNPLAAGSEIRRLLTPGGLVVISVRSKYAKIRELVAVEDFSNLAELLATGRIPVPTDDPEEATLCHFFTPDDLKRLLRRNGMVTERVIGKTVFATPGDSGILDNDTVFRRILDLERMFFDDPHLAGAAAHIEIVGRKKEEGA